MTVEYNMTLRTFLETVNQTLQHIGFRLINIHDSDNKILFHEVRGEVNDIIFIIPLVFLENIFNECKINMCSTLKNIY